MLTEKEFLNRTAKALALANVLRKFAIEPALVPLMTEEQWAMVAEAAGYPKDKRKISDLTRKAVQEIMMKGEPANAV